MSTFFDTHFEPCRAGTQVKLLSNGRWSEPVKEEESIHPEAEKVPALESQQPLADSWDGWGINE